MNKLLKVMTHLCAFFLGTAVALAIVLVGTQRNYSKLAELEKLIEKVFVGEYDETQMEDAAADAIEKAVEKVLDDGLRTPDIYTEGTTKIGTDAMGDAVAAAL